MWILPKQLHTLASVQVTEALISDLEEQSQICAQSLFLRSKVSPARTWSQKWKRDSWTQHLSGRILKPSHGQSFVTAWTSSLGAIPANHSQPQESDLEMKTQDTFGLSSQKEFPFADPAQSSLKTSKATFLWDSVKSLPTWLSSDTEWKAAVASQRGEYSARVKSARLTNANGSLSWPTISVNESKNSVGKSQLDRNSIPLGTMAAWTTPTPWQQEESLDSWETRKAKNKAKGYNGNGQGTPLDMQVKILGQAAPASSSSLGSRQGLWATPRCAMASMHPEYGQHWNDNRGGESIATQVWKEEHWATPQAHDAQGPKTPEQIAVMRAKGHGVKNLNEQAQWGTPTARDHKRGRGNEEREYKELTPMVERTQSGKLNPRWVETLMGLPVGWTMPSCASPVTIAPTNSGRSETELSRPPQS